MTESTTVSVEPVRLAKYLQIASAQRKRLASKMRIDFGEDSSAFVEVAADAAEIDRLISECVKAQAAAPRVKGAR